MKHIYLFLLAVFYAFGTYGQNLVPNPSFETVVTPPCSWLTSASQLPAAVANWTMPSDGSTDIFSDYVANTCYAHNFSIHSSAIGQQAPRTGRVQSAILTYGAGCGSMPNYREYLQVQLTSPMVSGQSYDFEFWISMADNSSTATNNFGVHFRTGSYYQATCFVIPLTPQFNSTSIISNKTSWVRVNGTITATANWSHIVIGNFFSNAATSTQAVGGSAANSRYFIDDIAVTPATILQSDDFQLEAARMADGSVSLDWTMPETQPEDGFLVQRSLDGSTWETIREENKDKAGFDDLFAPNTKVFYRVRYTNPDGESVSTATATIMPAESATYNVVVGPNPTPSNGTAYLRVANADLTEGKVEILELTGREIWESGWMQLTEMDNLPLSTDMLRPGIYLIQVRTQHTLLSTTRWVITD